MNSEREMKLQWTLWVAAHWPKSFNQNQYSGKAARIYFIMRVDIRSLPLFSYPHRPRMKSQQMQFANYSKPKMGSLQNQLLQWKLMH